MSSRSTPWALYRVARNISLAIVFLVFLGVAYVGLVIYLSRTTCVVLPNGYTLGPDTILSRSMFSRMTMISPMTLRDSNGKVLVGGRRDVDLLRDADAPPYGIILEYSDGRQIRMSGQEIMPLIWDATFFGHEWYQPSPGFPDETDIVATDLYLIYNKLKSSEKIEQVYCSTPWLYRGK